jgi:putative ABC transport system substrate-binding protein
VFNTSNQGEFDSVFATLDQSGVVALTLSGGDPFFASRGTQLALAALAVRHKVPVAGAGDEFAAAGGLLSYGADIAESYRIAGVYAGRILKGEKPTDLPVQQATKVELIINLKTAKALGIEVPIPLLGRADEVIE